MNLSTRDLANKLKILMGRLLRNGMLLSGSSSVIYLIIVEHQLLMRRARDYQYNDRGLLLEARGPGHRDNGTASKRF